MSRGLSNRVLVQYDSKQLRIRKYKINHANPINFDACGQYESKKFPKSLKFIDIPTTRIIIWVIIKNKATNNIKKQQQSNKLFLLYFFISCQLHIVILKELGINVNDKPLAKIKQTIIKNNEFCSVKHIS